MRTSNGLLSSILLASRILATPIQINNSPITLPIAVHINAEGGTLALINRDRARFQAMTARGFAKSVENNTNIPIPVNDNGQIYLANVGVGAGNYSLIVDTGSSNTWIGANKPYIPSPKSIDTGMPVGVSYGSGGFIGEEYIDTLTIGSDVQLIQSFGVANESAGFNGLDGILGLGPDDLTEVSTPSNDVIPTVTDNMVMQGITKARLVGVSFVPSESAGGVPNGQLDFGAPNLSKYVGNITFTPKTTTAPASEYWGINQTITYGDARTPLLSPTSGFVDTGTTLLYIASDAFETYQASTNAVLDETTGLLTVDSVENLQSLFFTIGGREFEFTPNAQIWPQSMNSLMGGSTNATYLVVNNIGTPTGSGVDFVDGFVFLQRFYTVFDSDNSQIGFANTANTLDDVN
ncbi:hypothetical protein Clacol_007410 [Clathrus columnatus]|uniref:Peptidase A1 domain-containing protein n=1 Tax=Clathrus columnatus TaxID=1419009 RepID=A0AAV5AJ52_9AGAM|nr:hypothetical protein Clacol_007410 [Clathrus columnatus]